METKAVPRYRSWCQVDRSGQERDRVGPTSGKDHWTILLRRLGMCTYYIDPDAED